MQAGLLLAASLVPAPQPVTADQAIARQQALVREVAANPCRRTGDEDILVCGYVDRSVPTRRPRGYDPERQWSAPAEGPWFSYDRGPLSISCCSIRGSLGTGSGLSLRLRF